LDNFSIGDKNDYFQRKNAVRVKNGRLLSYSEINVFISLSFLLFYFSFLLYILCTRKYIYCFVLSLLCSVKDHVPLIYFFVLRISIFFDIYIHSLLLRRLSTTYYCISCYCYSQ
jgi:hypothetical protein